MKRANNLLEKIVEIENVQRSFCNAKRGKTFQKEVIEFQNNLDFNLANIRNELQNNTVIFGDYNFFTIYDPKERLICAASFKERVIHHALMNVCDSVFEKKQIYYSYACRQNKGNHAAVIKAQKFSHENIYYLKMDIAKYFNSVDHAILKKLLLKIFKDKTLIAIFDKIIDSYSVSSGKGLPIGNLTSQYFANFYLSFLDRFIKENLKCRYYIRYMDDFVVWDNDNKTLKRYLQEIRIFLNNELQLSLKDTVQINRTCNGLNFLGYKVYQNTIRLNKSSKIRFKRKFKQYVYLYNKGIWSEKELSKHFQGIVNFTLLADSVNLRRKIIEKYDVVV